MVGFRKALVLSTLLIGALTSPAIPKHDDSLVDWDQFQNLLDTIDTSALHNVLHSVLPKFKDGVFSRDRSAVEHVHSEDPIVASKLIHIAKRAGSNSTTATSASVTPSPSTPSQSSEIAQSSSRAASVSSALSSAVHASTVPASTSIKVAPSTPVSATPVATSNGAVVFSTYGGGVVTLTSSAVGVHFSPSTSTHLFYATMGDGQVETSTALVVVNAPVTETGSAATGAAGAASTSSSSPGLQNSAPQEHIAGWIAVIAAGLVGAASL